jgi:hypothetical protein
MIQKIIEVSSNVKSKGRHGKLAGMAKMKCLYGAQLFGRRERWCQV